MKPPRLVLIAGQAVSLYEGRQRLARYILEDGHVLTPDLVEQVRLSEQAQ